VTHLHVTPAGEKEAGVLVGDLLAAGWHLQPDR
jgi:hypothetical protein